MAVRGSDTVDADYAGASQVDRVETDGVVLATSLLGVASDRAPHRADNHFTRDDTGIVVGRRIHDTPIRQYYLADGLGSTVALVNPDGTVDRTYTYTPHGETTRSWVRPTPTPGASPAPTRTTPPGCTTSGTATSMPPSAAGPNPTPSTNNSTR